MWELMEIIFHVKLLIPYWKLGFFGTLQSKMWGQWWLLFGVFICLVFFLYERRLDNNLLVKALFFLYLYVQFNVFPSSLVCGNHVSVLASSNPSFLTGRVEKQGIWIDQLHPLGMMFVWILKLILWADSKWTVLCLTVSQWHYHLWYCTEWKGCVFIFSERMGIVCVTHACLPNLAP